MGTLDDRVAIVTGAAQGIGRAVARKLAEQGARGACCDLNVEGAERAVAELPDALGLRIDVSRPDDVRRMVEATLERYGGVDCLANVAALVPFTPRDEVTFDEGRRSTATNLDGVYLACRAVYGPMKEAGYGRLVNVASNVILAGTPNLAHYVAGGRMGR